MTNLLLPPNPKPIRSLLSPFVNLSALFVTTMDELGPYKDILPMGLQVRGEKGACGQGQLGTERQREEEGGVLVRTAGALQGHPTFGPAGWRRVGLGWGGAGRGREGQ